LGTDVSWISNFIGDNIKVLGREGGDILYRLLCSLEFVRRYILFPAGDSHFSKSVGLDLTATYKKTKHTQKNGSSFTMASRIASDAT
jgi:hypothetical protein